MANIKDVAKLAGVSVTTVSRVLNNKGYISQDTYESVYKAIDQLDYVLINCFIYTFVCIL